MSSQDPPAVEAHRVWYGSRRIDFSLTRSPRKTLAITAHPDLSISVVAPLDASPDKVIEKVQGRSRWILKERRQFLSWMPKPQPRAYQGGETHRYLGRQYQLKIVELPTSTVKLVGKYLTVATPDKRDTKAVEKAVKKWYRDRASVQFERQLSLCWKRVAAYKLPEPKLRLLSMRKRWGSCTSNGEIILNPDLVKSPVLCIEYVVMHELCHLRHPNHSRAFFNMLDAILPDWMARKERLERVEI
jgi:predicted metal-dependent hydrolase